MNTRITLNIEGKIENLDFESNVNNEQDITDILWAIRYAIRDKLYEGEKHE